MDLIRVLDMNYDSVTCNKLGRYSLSAFTIFLYIYGWVCIHACMSSEFGKC